MTSFAEASGSPITVGNNPHYVGQGLFNVDNFIDLAITNSDENTVTVLLGNGAGGFTVTPGSPIAVGTYPITVEVGDFNNDNKADLAVSNQNSNDVTILLGDGIGGFTPAMGSPVAVGTHPRAVAKGNFNGDANLDLVVSNGGSDNLTILLGDGSGGFSAAPGSPVAAGFAPFHTVVGNFNADANADLAVANFGDGTIMIFLGNGSGGFTQSGSAIPSGTFTSFIAKGNFNADANLDLAVTNRLSDNVVILLGDGNGGFAQAPGSPYGVGTAPVAVAAGDINLDGHLDLVVSNEQSANASVLLGDGNGGFSPATALSKGVFPTNLTLADFNGDNRLDIAAANGGDDNVMILLNTCGSCPTLTVSPATIPAGTSGTAYSQTFTASGGTGPYGFSLTGTLPTGLGFTGNTLSGTPTQTGNFPITITATDANNCTGSQNYTLVVNPATCPTITVNPPTIAAGTAGTVYTQTFTQSGGAGSVTYGLTGALPAGLNFSGDTLSGTPTQTGNFPITVTATDANNCTGSRAYTLVVNCQTITVNPASIAAGTAGTPYSQTFTQVGGIGATTFALTGTLPGGLSFASDTLSGTPTQMGSFPITVTATDANGCAGSQNYALVINCPAITITPSSLPNGFVGTAYNQTLTAGGIAPVMFTISGGTLPGGLTLTAAGVLSGTPTASGSFTFTVTATDAGNCTGSQQYTILVSGGGLLFYPLARPVRLLDTRMGAAGCYHPDASIPGGTSRTQPARGTCDGLTIPANAQAITGNITTVQSGGGFLALYPSDAAQPTVANSNYAPNEVVNNVFTVGLGAADGAFKIFVQNTTDVVVDVTGYYAPPGTGGLYFHPLPKPIRLLETRAGATGCTTPNAPLPGGVDTTQQARGTCDGVTIPASALAIVGNATTVNPQGPGFPYLTLFPADATRPTVASSNYLPGQVMNAPFTVGLSAAGEFKIYPTTQTDLVVDVLGYYSAEVSDANGAGLLFNPLPHPVRLLDTRSGATGCDTPNAPLLAGSTRTQAARGVCDGVTIAADALGIVGNATVVNTAGGYLTFWPSGAAQPLVATTNFTVGQVFNRHFTVGLGAGDGAFKIFTQFQTDLVVDVSGYFAP